MELSNVHAEILQVLPPSTDYALLFVNALISLLVGFGGVYLGYCLSQKQRYRELEVARLANLRSECLYFHSLCATQLNNIANYLIPACKVSERLRVKREAAFFNTVNVVAINYDRFGDILSVLPTLSVSVSSVLSALDSMNGMIEFTQNNMLQKRYDENNAFPLIAKQIWESLDIAVLCYEKLSMLIDSIMLEYKNAEYEFFCSFKMKQAFHNKLLIEKRSENRLLLTEARQKKDFLRVGIINFYLEFFPQRVVWKNLEKISNIKKRR